MVKNVVDEQRSTKPFQTTFLYLYRRFLMRIYGLLSKRRIQVTYNTDFRYNSCRTAPSDPDGHQRRLITSIDHSIPPDPFLSSCSPQASRAGLGYRNLHPIANATVKVMRTDDGTTKELRQALPKTAARVQR